MRSLTISVCKNSPRSGPTSIASICACMSVIALPSMEVFPMSPPDASTTCFATSNTAMVMGNVLLISVTAMKVLKIHLKKIHVSKFARLL